jgi:excisionase family DNA binding protein
VTAAAPDCEPTAAAIAELPEILSPEQAAWLLQVSTNQLLNAARRDEIPWLKFGRARRFSKTALLKLGVDA